MGVIYTVACRECKVSRDLDKFYSCRPVKNKKEALDVAEQIKTRDYYRAALLASFMAAHIGHNCTVFTDNYEDLSDELDSDYGNTKADGDFWK
jgi:hypothetical protein